MGILVSGDTSRDFGARDRMGRPDIHDDAMKWTHFPRYWTSVTGAIPSQRTSDA